MDESVLDQRGTCLQCGAVVLTRATKCWLCAQPLRSDSAEAPAAEPRRAGGQAPPDCQDRAAFQFGLSSLMLIVTLTAVVCGVFSISPGVGMAICIISAPALVRTCLVVARRKSKGRSVSGVEKSAMYLGSFFVTAIILSVLGVVAYGSFFAVCLGLVASYPRIEESAMGIAIGAAVLMTVLAAWPLAIWVRHRWRKAVRENETVE